MTNTNARSSGSDSGRGVIDRVREGAATQLANQKSRATEGLGSIAHAVRQSADSFREHHQDTLAEYIATAADQIDRFSSRVQERDLRDLVNDAERFARRRPTLFIGAAFAAGVLTARFLKSSASREPAERSPQAGRLAYESDLSTSRRGSITPQPYSTGGM